MAAAVVADDDDCNREPRAKPFWSRNATSEDSSPKKVTAAVNCSAQVAKDWEQPHQRKLYGPAGPQKASHAGN